MTERVKGTHICTPAYYSVQLLTYYEKFKLLDIYGKILFDIGKARPVDANKWLEENLERISNEILCNKTYLLIPPHFDTEKLLRTFKKKHGIPTFVYSGDRKYTIDEIYDEFDYFLKKNKLYDKNIIIINNPSSCAEVLELKKKYIEPSRVIDIEIQQQPGSQCCCCLDHLRTTSCEVRNFYKDISKVIKYGHRSDGKDRKQTIKEISEEIIRLMQSVKPTINQLKKGEHCLRIIVFGRKGSGRGVQAKLISKRFNLVYINTELLVKGHMKNEHCVFGDTLRKSVLSENEISKFLLITSIYKRILQRDCSQFGWILHGFPFNKESFKIIQEQFICPANKIIFLHCREKLCLRRLENKLKKVYGSELDVNTKRNDGDSFNIFKEEMSLYNLYKGDVYKYLETRKETIHINANHSVKTVTQNVFSKIIETQYLI